MSVVLVTGAATGIGRLTALKLARSGHTVYASMRGPEGRNSAAAGSLLDLKREEGVDLRVVELDVQSSSSAVDAADKVVDEAGRIDVVVQNAGHLTIGYTEAFTAEDVQRLLDINAVGAHRVNRAVLPHMRRQRSGTLIYVSSTTVITTPAFMGPYVASKAAFDMLALCTSFETNAFGIETSIVMPGAFTQGTEHFPHADAAADRTVSEAYSILDPLVARTEEATDGLFTPGVDADPDSVAVEIDRIVTLPFGEKPLRAVVDFTGDAVPAVNDVITTARDDFITRMGFSELLTVWRT